MISWEIYNRHSRFFRTSRLEKTGYESVSVLCKKTWFWFFFQPRKSNIFRSSSISKLPHRRPLFRGKNFRQVNNNIFEIRLDDVVFGQLCPHAHTHTHRPKYSNDDVVHWFVCSGSQDEGQCRVFLTFCYVCLCW